MKKLLLAASLLVSSLAFSQPKQLTSAQIERAASIVKSNIDFKAIESELIVLINAYRLSLNLDTLIFDSNVQKAAKFQVDYNISINKLTHDNLGSMYGVLDRVEKFTLVRPSTAGEVLANMSPLFSSGYDQTIAEFIFTMWKNSPGHNKILVSPKMKTIGVSVSRKDNKSGAIFAGAVLNSL
jgi:uncharacterized protein YkwD